MLHFGEYWVLSSPNGKERGLPLIRSIMWEDQYHWNNLYGVVYIVKHPKDDIWLSSLSNKEIVKFCRAFYSFIVLGENLDPNEKVDYDWDEVEDEDYETEETKKPLDLTGRITITCDDW